MIVFTTPFHDCHSLQKHVSFFVHNGVYITAVHLAMNLMVQIYSYSFFLLFYLFLHKNCKKKRLETMIVFLFVVKNVFRTEN